MQIKSSQIDKELKQFRKTLDSFDWIGGSGNTKRYKSKYDRMMFTNPLYTFAKDKKKYLRENDDFLYSGGLDQTKRFRRVIKNDINTGKTKGKRSISNLSKTKKKNRSARNKSLVFLESGRETSKKKTLRKRNLKRTMSFSCPRQFSQTFKRRNRSTQRELKNSSPRKSRQHGNKKENQARNLESKRRLKRQMKLKRGSRFDQSDGSFDTEVGANIFDPSSTSKINKILNKRYSHKQENALGGMYYQRKLKYQNLSKSSYIKSKSIIDRR